MMRMGLIVVGLSTLTVMELGTPSVTLTSAPDPFDQLTIDESKLTDTFASDDTLETADRLAMHKLQPEATLQTVSRLESPPEVSALVSRHSNIVGGGTKNSDVVRKPKPKRKDTVSSSPTHSIKAVNTKRSKAFVEAKSCRPNALESFLQALNLPSRCQI